MARVVCDLPNVTSPINGVKFTQDREEWISEEVPDDVAEAFGKIPGYRVLPKPTQEKPAPQQQPEPTALPGDTDGDGRLSTAEKRAQAAALRKAAAQPPVQAQSPAPPDQQPAEPNAPAPAEGTAT